ncbi:cell cycle control protein, partial [Aureobasidium melanogenum]
GKAAPTNNEQAAADAILADAAAETQARNAEDEDAPAVVGEDEDMDYSGPTMASGAMAGLQTAEQVTKALKRKEREEKKAMQEMGLDPTGKAQETIYRDASGRIINVAMKRAELRRQADEEERKKAEEAENRRGDVQKREKEARMRELEKAKTMSLSRYADDRELNDEQKEQERWNDPALAFLSKGTTKGSKGTKGRKKTYTGAFEPNRYGIRPGYRWDGVDRSIGFEKRWFEARNQQQNIKDLQYAWQMDE